MKNRVWRVLKQAAREFSDDDATTLAGALAFYTALSIAPVLILVLAIAGFFWQAEAVRAELIRLVAREVGPSGAQVVATVMREAGEQHFQGTAALIGVGALLFGATTVFAQLQYSLNRMWNVEPKPGGDVMSFVRKRLLSLAMILAISLLLVASLMLSAALSYIRGSAVIDLPGGFAAWRALDLVVSLLVYTGIFTVVHHLLPDVKMAWKDSLVGGAITAVLFALGKELLGWYLGRASTGSAYGAAGSFFVVLLWVYYSSLILFIGAEITQAFAREMKHPVVPAPHARLTPRGDEQHQPA